MDAVKPAGKNSYSGLLKVWVEKILKHTFRIMVVKLVLLCLAIILINIVVLVLINRCLEFSFRTPLFIGSIPFIIFLIFCLGAVISTGFSKSKFLSKLSRMKYNPLFPFYYYFPAPKRSSRIDVKVMETAMNNCGQEVGVALRRCKNYIDGLIFSENSYFTHAGIFYKDNNGEYKIFHANAESGVHEYSIEKFCDCDDVIVLGFSLDETEEDIYIRNYIHADIHKEPPLINEELNLFEDLLGKTKLEHVDVNERTLLTNQYSTVILRTARSLAGVPYDLRFNFENFDQLSCVEFVWYCYKCLFPFHRIRVKDFEFFSWIKLPVIIPDVFVKNDFFNYIWSSVPGVENMRIRKNITEAGMKKLKKKQLKKIVKDSPKQLWVLVRSILFWNLIILFSYYFITKYLKW